MINKSINVNIAIAIYLLFPSLLFGVLNGFSEEFVVAFAFIIFLFITYDMINDAIVTLLNENNFKTYQNFLNFHLNLLNINFELKNKLKNNRVLLAKNNFLFYFLTQNICNKYNLIILSLIKNYIKTMTYKFNNLKLFIKKLNIYILYLLTDSEIFNKITIDGITKVKTNEKKFERIIFLKWFLKNS